MPRLSLARIWTPKFYDRIARHYDRYSGWIAPEGESAQHLIIAGLREGAVLDIGCGTGALLALADECGLATFGIDTSGGMLAEARHKAPKARLIKASFYKLPFPDNHFEAVVETNALSGVDILPEQAIAEMLRVCKPGGLVYLADYAEPPKRSWGHKLIEWAGILVGDYPYNYQKLFRAIGYKPQSEIIGGHGMYQVIKVTK